MAKGKRGTKNNPIVLNAGKLKEFINGSDRSYQITEATIKDDFCHYTYEITSGVGVGIGDQHKVTGTGIIDGDLHKAFKKFCVHLAVIECAFLHSGIEIDDIDKFHDHDLTDLFIVTGFKISGAKDNEKIQLIGNKYCSEAGGRLEIKTHKIPLDKNSVYTWYNELNTAAATARNEVALYKEGKYTAVEKEEDTNDPAQMTLELGAEENKSDEFENAKV